MSNNMNSVPIKGGDIDEPQVMETEQFKEMELAKQAPEPHNNYDHGGNQDMLNPHTQLPQAKSQTEAKKASLRMKEIIFMTVFQIAMIVLFATCTTFGND